MSESDKTYGYKRGLDGKSSSMGALDGWLDSKEQFEDRRAGYEQGVRDRARIEAEKKSKK